MFLFLVLFSCEKVSLKFVSYFEHCQGRRTKDSEKMILQFLIGSFAIGY